MGKETVIAEHAGEGEIHWGEKILKKVRYEIEVRQASYGSGPVQVEPLPTVEGTITLPKLDTLTLLELEQARDLILHFEGTKRLRFVFKDVHGGSFHPKTWIYDELSK